MGHREVTNSELTACCTEAFGKVAKLLQEIDQCIGQLNLDAGESALRRYNLCDRLVGIWAACARRSTQHFYPTIKLDDLQKVITFETEMARDPFADYKTTLLTGIKAQFVTEFLRDEMATSRLSRVNGTSQAFAKCSQICVDEMLWLERAIEIYRAGVTPSEMSIREHVVGLPCQPKIADLCKSL